MIPNMKYNQIPSQLKIGQCKLCFGFNTKKKYKLSNDLSIYVCQDCGFDFVNFLRPLETQSDVTLEESDKDYIRNYLQSNFEKLNDNLSLVKKHIGTIAGKCFLDVGAGGGLWLSILKNQNASEIVGIEIDQKRIAFAKEEYNIDLSDELIESRYWDKFANFFDAITLWDVIEHVNNPVQMLSQCFKLLKPGSYLFLDTPIRDCLYDYASYIWYFITLGKSTLFLRSKYSKEHLQIFHSSELLSLARDIGFSIADYDIKHELTFPYSFYFRRFTSNKKMQDILGNCAKIFFKIFKIRNKIVCALRKEAP